MNEPIQSVRKGQRIFYKPEWQDKGDPKITFLAQADSVGDSVEVVAMLGLLFNPWSWAKLYMIERVEDTPASNMVAKLAELQKMIAGTVAVYPNARPL